MWIKVRSYLARPGRKSCGNGCVLPGPGRRWVHRESKIRALPEAPARCQPVGVALRRAFECGPCAFPSGWLLPLPGQWLPGCFGALLMPPYSREIAKRLARHTGRRTAGDSQVWLLMLFHTGEEASHPLKYSRWWAASPPPRVSLGWIFPRRSVLTDRSNWGFPV